MTSRHAIVLALLLALGCGAATEGATTRPVEDPLAGWTAWRAERREELTGPDGWLALVGLFWIEPGESSIGSDPASTFVLPSSAPAHLGRVIAGGEGEVRFVADPSASVMADGAAIHELTLSPDAEPLAIGSLRMVLIVRGDRRALRVRDLDSPARAAFGELPVYDYDPSLRIRARVRPPEPGRMLSLVNVLGMQVDEPCVALIDVTLGGIETTLAASAGGEGPDAPYFVMLRDETAGTETYGAGRYLEVAHADAEGHTWVDLNRLYTPPCGYTHFATCPLPPEENVLSFPIRAGERYDH